MSVMKTVTAEEIRALIIRLLGQIAPEADFETLAADEDIREAFDIDSFDFLQFLIGLNKETGVEIPESDYGRLTTLEDLVSYLKAHVG